MMPVSQRIGASFDASLKEPAARPTRARARRSANSSTLAIVVATTFALLTALVSLAPDPATRAAPDDLAVAPLRGTLPAIGETTH